MELRKAEVRWIRAVPKPGEMTEEETKSEELYKRFQGILNKLTPQKFQALAEQALKLDITTEERLRGCIDKIFSKVRGGGIGISRMPPLQIQRDKSYFHLCSSPSVGARGA